MYTATDVLRKGLVLGALLLPIAATADSPSTAAMLDMGTDGPTYQARPFYPPPPGGDYPSGFMMNDSIPWESKVAPFSTGYNYNEREKTVILADELKFEQARGENARTALDFDNPAGHDPHGGPLFYSQLIVDQGDIPEATQPSSISFDGFLDGSALSLGEGGDSSLQMSSASLPFFRPFNTRREFGNNIFGSIYNISAFVQATPNEGHPPTLEGRVENRVDARVFNQTIHNVTHSFASTTSSSDGISTTVRVYAMGNAIYRRDHSVERTFSFVDRSRNFFSRRKIFMVGPVPVTVQAQVSGNVQMDATVTPFFGGFTLNVTPATSASVVATGAVSVIVLGVGVTGTLSLIDVSFPAEAHIAFANQQLTWGLNVRQNLTTLSGNISVWTRVRFIFFNRRWDLTIARWNGIVFRDQTLFDQGGTQPIQGSFSGPVSVADYNPGL